MELTVLDYKTLLLHFSTSLSSDLGEDVSRKNGGHFDMFVDPKLRRRGPHSTAEMVAETSVESRRHASNGSNIAESEGRFPEFCDGGSDTPSKSTAKSKGGPIDMLFNPKLRCRGPHSTAEIVAENSVESRRHAAHDLGLCPRRELRVRDDSSSMRADQFVSYGSNDAKPEGWVPEFCDGRGEEVARNGSNNAKPEGRFSEFCDSGLETSLKSEAATLAKERELFVAEVMNSLGPLGSGLLAVRGVPEVAELRKKLLPLAKKLALMPDAIRRPVLKKYGLSTDVPLKRPDRPVSAFATKLEYSRHSHAADGSCISSPISKPSPGCLCDVFNNRDLSNVSKSKDVSNGSDDLFSALPSDLEQLGSIVRKLGASMVEIGLLVARLCDSAIPGAHLEDATWESGSAKARLIHYHSYSEKTILAKSAKIGNGFTNEGALHKLSKSKGEIEDTDKGASRKLSKTKEEFESEVEEIFKEIEEAVQAASAPANPRTAHNVARVPEELWQEWHYDYGIFTILTAPMFLSSSQALAPGDSVSECESWPGGHTGLRILSRGSDNFVRVPSDCLIVQVGEAAQIASGGKLAAVAHCVSRTPNGEDSSREMFVTFLQPAWDRVLRPPMGVTRAEVFNLVPQDTCKGVLNPPIGMTRAEVLNLEPKNTWNGVLRPPIGQTRAEVRNLGPQNGEPESKEENFRSQESSSKANEFSENYAKLFRVVPSLESRWKEGCTFAEFSRETTAQYYGAHGRQSQRTGHPSAG